MTTESFKKQAKQLRKKASALEPDAVARVRKVYPNHQNELRLVRAQHVIAVEQGFPNWSTLQHACNTLQRPTRARLLHLDIRVCSKSSYNSDIIGRLMDSTSFRVMKQQQALDELVQPLRSHTAKIREVLQAVGGVPDEAFQSPLRMMSIYRVVRGYSAMLSKTLEQAQYNAKHPLWAVDFGHWAGTLRNPHVIMQALQSQGIPFWQDKGALGLHYSAMKYPDTNPDLYQEIVEGFGPPEDK